MSEVNILTRMSEEKSKLIEQLIEDYLGHSMSEIERSDFDVMSSLTESRIYHHGLLIGHLRFSFDGQHLYAEYL